MSDIVILAQCCGCGAAENVMVEECPATCRACLDRAGDVKVGDHVYDYEFGDHAGVITEAEGDGSPLVILRTYSGHEITIPDVTLIAFEPKRGCEFCRAPFNRPANLVCPYCHSAWAG